MKSTTLLAILPLLASLSSISAHPHKHHKHDDLATVKGDKRVSRKSLGFGPSHPHAKYVAFPAGEVNALVQEERTATEIGEGLLKTLGFDKDEGYYIRKDSYEDSRTGVNHIYVKQVVNGLEVADGDININIDRDGNVLSYGDSFHRGLAPPLPGSETDSFINLLSASSRSHKHSSDSARCEQLNSMIWDNQHARKKLMKALRKLSRGEMSDEDKGLKELVKGGLKAVTEILFGVAPAGEDRKREKLRKHVMDKLQRKFNVSSEEEVRDLLDSLERHGESLEDHLDVVCAAPKPKDTAADSFEGDNDLPFHGPVKALVILIQHVSPDAALLPPSEDIASSLSIHYDSTLLPPADGRAPLEPPVVVITGQGLKASGIEDDVRARLMYHQVNVLGEDGEERMDLRLVWKLEARLSDNWYEASVDVEDLKIVGIVDWASDAPPSRRLTKGGKQKPLPAPGHKIAPYSYSVFPFYVNDPTVGNLSLEHAPWDTLASPAGWHAFPDKVNPWKGQKIQGMETGTDGPIAFNVSRTESAFKGNKSEETWTRFATTMGNNVFAQEDWEGASNWLHNGRPVNSSLVFDSEYGEPDGLRPKEYIDMAVTQLFYTSNMYHDLLYRLGFDEVSGNFQMENFGKGGLGGDGVICQAQDGSGTNNANFMTPPDGTQPRMRMYVWDTATPYRDGDLEAGIVIHEYSHGLSTRLTGGPQNSGCLGYGEAGGMGEGWGDAFATIIRQISEAKSEDFAMGSWAANRPTGIRNYRYSTNSTVNPSSFKTLDKPGYWVWAEMLYVVEKRLIAKHGFSDTLFPPTDAKDNDEYYLTQEYDVKGKPKPLVPKHGNTLIAHLLVEGMKLQPCRPSFVNARDAIIQADVVLTGGNNTCDIWKAFAERGLGVEARTVGQLPWGGGVRSEDFTVPKICNVKGKIE